MPTQAYRPFFARSSFWNAPLSREASLASNSAELTEALNTMVREEEAAKSGPWMSTTGYSTPIYRVPASQAPVYVHLDNTEPALQAAFSAVPLPANAHPASGSDANLVVWQPSRDRMWEFWRLRDTPDGWHAKWGGAMQHVSQNPGIYGPEAWPGARSDWGASATSLPIVGGLITFEDIRRKQINHALALGLPRTTRGVFVWPAQRTDGAFQGPEAVPEGTRFRLDPQLDLNSLALPPLIRMMAEAAQRYGLVVRDKSGIVDFYGEDPTPTGSNPYPALFNGDYPWQQLAKFPWSHLIALAPRASR